MPKLGSSSSSSSSKRASARARAFPARLSGASSGELGPRRPRRRRARGWRFRQGCSRARLSPMARPEGRGAGSPGRRRRRRRRDRWAAASFRARKQGSQPRRRDHAAQIEADFQARPLEPPLGDEAPAPERGRNQQRRRGKADELHHKVGGDRARSAEKIVDARVGRVIELGSLTDQVSSARVRLATPASATRPAISAARRFGNSRTEAGTWSINENVVVRIAHLPGRSGGIGAAPGLTLGAPS